MRWKRRSVVRALLVAVALTLTIAPAPPASALQSKYYIVGVAQNGQQKSLFSVAAATLANGNRYPEIFALNRDRIQPDGQRLTDPLVIEPGWVLELPPDATGPGVRIGPVPIYALPTASASNDARDSAPGEAAAGRGVVTLDPVAADRILAVVGFLGLALGLLRRGRRPEAPARRPPPKGTLPFGRPCPSGHPSPPDPVDRAG
jgi:hypothetical protein